MSDLTERINEALDGRATTGAWAVEHAGNMHYGVKQAEADPRIGVPLSVVYAHCGFDGFGNGSRRQDAEFIAAAPALLREAAEQLADTTQDRDEWVGACQSLRRELAAKDAEIATYRVLTEKLRVNGMTVDEVLAIVLGRTQ
jgi:hypothetical protein